MPSIGFKRLSRGVKLLTQHIHAQIGAALTRVTSTRVEPDNLESGVATTRMTFSWPIVSNRALPGNVAGLATASFILPPPQEIWRSDYSAFPQDPIYILDTVSLSFDSRAEPAAIDDNAAAALNFSKSGQVKFKLDIHEKPISTTNAEATNTVVSIEYPNLGFAGDQIRTNPQVREQLGVQFSPYRSYHLAVDCTEYMGSDALMAPSVTVSLTFRSMLRPRDTGSGNVQNIPEGGDMPVASRYGAPYTQPQTILTPAATAQIVASTTATDEGVQGALEKMDASVRTGLIGGMTEFSRRHGFENLLNDAGYEVIAVPMWGNGWFVQDSALSNYQLLPYVGGAFDQPVADRRIIPLHFPMTVHHVLAFVNHQGGIAPATATHKYGIGVGMGTGIRADSHGYRQVAYATWGAGTGNTLTDYLVDTYFGSDTSGAGNLVSVPLVGTGGVGFKSQGKPMFVGKTNNSDVTRSGAANVVGGGNVAIASVDGKEQWLEVRMMFQDTAGINNLPASQTLVGWGGHWVYIIGKKLVC